MTKPRDPEALLAAYFADGMDVLPDRVIDSILEQAHRTRQRTVFGPQRTRRLFKPALAAAAVVVVLVATGSFFVILRVVGPGPTTSPSPSPSLPGVVAPSPAPSDRASEPTNSPIADPAGVWITTGTMGIPRYVNAAVRLVDGRVLVLGGASDGGVTSAELYDPLTGTWTATASMANPGEGGATLLHDGRVLMADLEGADPDDPTSGILGAEIYDPQRGTWTATGKMVGGGGVATLLRDGKVLVTGNGVLPSGNGSAQVFDPDLGTWTAAGRMINPRHGHAAILLPDGRVLVAGGHVVPDFPTDSAELFDPVTGTWTATADMHIPRETIDGFLQRDGTVLVVGSTDGDPQSAELYDPASGTWTGTGGLSTGANHESATMLQDGRVLLTGNDNTAELYDPATGSWSAAASMLGPHASAVLLLDGTVLMAGGRDCLDQVCVPTGSAELYVPAGVAPPPFPAFPTPPPPVFPSPTPIPTPVPPAVGPIPPEARTWKVTVSNKSSGPATLFVAEENEQGLMGRLVGSATPNVVPPGATVKVTFLLPATATGWAIFVNPGPNNGPSAGPAEMSLPGEIFINQSGQTGWLSP